MKERSFKKVSSLVVAFTLFFGSFAAMWSAPGAEAATVSQVRTNVLNYLSGLPNTTSNRVLTGQFTQYGQYAKMEESFAGATSKMGGKAPAIVGVDYASLIDTSTIYTPQPNNIVRQQWLSGGLATISVHFPNPYDPSQGSRGQLSNNTDIFTSGTATYNRWQSYLSQVADGLQELRDQGIVVLWRPLHESNGDWFWWCTGGTGRVLTHDNYKRLWTDMYNYFTNTRGLNNLIWVYSPFNTGDANSVTLDYPGTSYVDMTGLDVYTSDISPNAIKGYDQLVALNKPFAFTEFGSCYAESCVPSNWEWTNLINGIKTYFPKTVYFQAWYGSWTIGYTGTDTGRANFTNDAWTATRDEVPGLSRTLTTQILNPGFESGESWWKFSESHFSVSTDDKYSGTKSAKVVGTGANNYSNLFQVLYVTPNTNYTVTFKAKSNMGVFYKITDESYNVVGTASGTTNTNNTWTSYTLNFNSGSRSIVYLMFTDGGTGTAYFDDVTITGGSSSTDTQAPTAPTGLTSTGKTDTSVSLSWTASTDNVGVTGYDIYRNGTYATSVTGTSGTVTGLSANTTYSFTVKAKDAAGNVSPASSALSVTTNAAVTNLIANPGFENGTTSWNAGSAFSLSTTDKNTGTNSVKLTGTSGFSNLFQSVNVAANTNYTLKFWAKSGASHQVKVVTSGWNMIASTSTTANNTWTQYTLTFNSGSNTQVIISATDTASGTSYFDDFVLN